jgi:5-methylcytosine-specific restriction endonuclease McrA
MPGPKRRIITPNGAKNREQVRARRRKLKEAYCKKCGSNSDLYLHHIIPFRYGGVSSDVNCITLCKTCHLETHTKISISMLQLADKYPDVIDFLFLQSVK